MTVQCPDCGPGLVPLEAVHLRVNREHDLAAIAFPCALCGIRSALPVSAHSVAVLVAAGIEPEYWSYPAELTEREVDPRGSFPNRSIEGLVQELESDIDSFLQAG